MPNSSFLNTPADMEWLRGVHLTQGGFAHRWRILNTEGDSRRDGPYFGDFTEFGSAIISGNEDSPDSVDLYFLRNPQYNSPFVRWTAN